MTKPKDKSFVLNVQPEPDYVQIRALVAKKTNVDLRAIKAAAPHIAAIADVPQDRGCPAFLLNIEKRSLPRMMLSGDGLASKDAV